EETPTVRVVMMEPENLTPQPPSLRGLGKNAPLPVGEGLGRGLPKNRTPQTPSLRGKGENRPVLLSLLALEARARGESVPDLGTPHDTENDSDRAQWRTPRERVGPVSPADAVLWAVLERWDFSDRIGWVPLLNDALDDTPDRAVGDELQPKLRRFA